MAGSYDAAVLEKLHKVEVEMFKDFISICDKYGIDYFVIAGTAIGTVRHQGFIPWDDDIDIAMLRKDYERFVEVSEVEFKDKYEWIGADFKKKYYNFQPAMSKIGTKFVTETAYGNYEPGIFLDIFVFENVPDDIEETNKLVDKCLFLRSLYLIRNGNHIKMLAGKDSFTKFKYIICGIIKCVLCIIPHSRRYILKAYKKLSLANYGKTNTYTALCDPGAKKLVLRTEDIFPLKEMPFEGIMIKMVNEYDKMLKTHMGNYMEIPPENKRVNHCPMELDFGEE